MGPNMLHNISEQSLIGDNHPHSNLLPEADFLSIHPSPDNLTLYIHLPNQPSSPFNFKGQILLLHNIKASFKIKQIKEIISQTYSKELNQLPSNKMQIKYQNNFVKDGLSLAFVNCYGGKDYFLELLPKTRGGR